MIKMLSNFLKQSILKGLRFYQKYISLDSGPLKELKPFGVCRYHPHCSEYSYQAIERFGLIKGGFLSFWRLLRCNPLSSGGYDPIPKEKNRK